MNINNNLRAKHTRDKIDKALMYLLKRKEYNQIFIKDICTIACIHRSSFYSHYQDINDLMMQTEMRLSNTISEIFTTLPYTHEMFKKLFEFIKDNQDFYLAYIKNNENNFMERTDILNYNEKFKTNSSNLPFNNSELFYHLAFFSAGIKALCKVWLLTGLKESPKEMADILYKEYNNRN